MRPEERRQAYQKEVRFQTKPEIALDQIRSLVTEDVPRAPVLANAAYGNDSGFRDTGGWLSSKRFIVPALYSSAERRGTPRTSPFTIYSAAVPASRQLHNGLPGR